MVDLDSPDEGAKDLAPAEPVQAVQSLAHLRGEVLKSARYKGQVALGLGRFEGRLMLLGELGQSSFHSGDARLELGLVDHPLRIAVDSRPIPRFKVAICRSSRAISSGAAAPSRASLVRRRYSCVTRSGSSSRALT